MPEITVKITETAVYSVTVEAANQEEALENAMEKFLQSDDLNEFFIYVEDREATLED